MDARAFDLLARSLGLASSRRQALPALALGLAALARLPGEQVAGEQRRARRDVAASRKKKKRKKKKKCQVSCTGRECGPSNCPGQTCGTCPANARCTAAGQCVCVPQCAGRQCGSDTCGGQCAPGCAGGPCCGGECINPATNPNHCGGCDQACVPRGDTCVGGQCQCGSFPRCPEGANCVSGHCVCPGNQVYCLPACLDQACCAINQGCTSSTDCCNPNQAECSNNRCCLKTGSTCGNGTECCSDVCNPLSNTCL